MRCRGVAVDFRPVERPADAFQQSLSADEVRAVFAHVFRGDAEPTAVVELGAGLYNNVYRVTVTGQSAPLILRAAPPAERQFRSERHLMRNEFASQPWLAPIAQFMPQVVAADWTGSVIERDWMIQTYLDGVPAPDILSTYPRDTFPGYFRQMGAITRSVHDVRGDHFGPVAGPAYGSWSDALLASFDSIAFDLDTAGLDSADLQKVMAIASDARPTLDEITEPMLLTGDLWTINCLLASGAPEPTITGVLDFDRTWFGDPAADWTIRMAKAKQDERQAFWETYGQTSETPEARWRELVYEARHLGGIRLERLRLGKDDLVADSYPAMEAILNQLT
nr:aminoglycoside phosphotransferase family protein [Kineosporia babensis]